MTDKSLVNTVQDQYAAIARSALSNDSAAVQAVAQAFGYSQADLDSLPPQANMGLSCGNPVAMSGLRPGEVVVDLGCGGGLDVLLAAKKVAPDGKAIGIDMTAEMLARARAGAQQVGATNVEFHQAQIDHMPLADGSVDCIISNCVINLAPDKPAVFREMLRVLKPGGRIAISDIALRQPLPEAVGQDLRAYVGCIAGAMLIDDYRRLLREAGFDAVVVQDTGANLNAYAEAGSSSCCSSTGCCSAEMDLPETSVVHEGLAQTLNQFDANAYAASVRVQAIKPSRHQPANSDERGTTMKTIHVYDKPMCCSTGVCGPDVDPVLPRFAADLQWLKSQGHQVERFNLAQQPEAFIKNPEIHRLLATLGTYCLPLIVVDGSIVSRRSYPSREMLRLWTQSSATTKATPVAKPRAECCGSKSCC